MRVEKTVYNSDTQSNDPRGSKEGYRNVSLKARSNLGLVTAQPNPFMYFREEVTTKLVFNSLGHC
jgi:hypothetical protein